MAQRLATEYVKAYLQLSISQFHQLLHMFSEEMPEFHKEETPNAVKLSFRDDETRVTLSFIKTGQHYVCQHPYRIKNHTLANLMRRMLATFKGNAIVNRIYPNFTMVYHYDHGSVVRITEVKDSRERLVYELKQKTMALQNLFDQTGVEVEIQQIQNRINSLLDLRNTTVEGVSLQEIDVELKALSHQLFVLEA
jgi:hypothetical protein